MNQLHLPILPGDHVWSNNVAEHFVDGNGNYIIQPNCLFLYGLKGNLNNFFEDKSANVLSDEGRRWTSAMYDVFPFFDKLQRNTYGKPHPMFEKNDGTLLAFAKFMLISFGPGQKSRFITSLHASATAEVLRRYNACVSQDNYFRVPAPQSIDDVLGRLTGDNQQKTFRGDKSTVYTPIFECFKSLPLTEGSEWLPEGILSYFKEQEMLVVLAPCNQCAKSRKHSLERWAVKKLLGPLTKKVELAETVAFGCKMIMHSTVDINDSHKMLDENFQVVRITSWYMPSKRRTSLDGGGSYYLQYSDTKAGPATSIIKQHFLAGLKVGRAAGMPIKDIKKELFEALKEYDWFGSQPGRDESMRDTHSEEGDDNDADANANEACIDEVNELFGVSLLDFW